MDGRKAGIWLPTAHGWHGKALRAHGGVHQVGKALVLGQGAGGHVVCGQQAFYPFTVEEQALLRAKAQVLLFVLPAASHAFAHAQFFEQVLYLGRVVAGHGQVVGTQRAGQAAHLAATAVAAHGVFQLQQGDIAGTAQAQRACRAQGSNTATGNHHLHLVGAAGGGQWQALL